MDDKLNLTLPGRERKNIPGRSSKVVVLFLCVLLLFSAANLFLSLYRVQRNKTQEHSSGLTSEKVKEMALRLEKQKIRDSAVQTWKEYLAQANPRSEEQAKIWYRIGKLLQDEGMYEQALTAYYRSESLERISELEPEINLRIQESLEALGKFAALRHELSDRVEISREGDKGAGTQVLAEIGGHKITELELDDRVEQLIERQLVSLVPFMPEEERKSQKESLLKRFSTGSERQSLLNQLVIEEMLHRKGIEDKLKENETVRMMIQDAERSILAQQVLTRELARKINITQGDLQTYYEAHKQEYLDPEKAKISHILVKDRETAGSVFKRLNEGAGFEDLVEEYSLDNETRENEGKINSWVERGGSISQISSKEEINSIIFNTEDGKIADEAVLSDKGFHIIKVREKKSQRQRDFEEVKQELFRSLRSQKENEVRQALLEQLKERYNVVIHLSKLREDSEGAGSIKH